MAFPKITEELTVNKGVTGLPDTPELSAGEMQQKFDELSKDVIIPFVNEHIDLLNAENGAENIGAKPTPNMSGTEKTLQEVLDALDNMSHTSLDGAKFDVVNGHLIITYADGTVGDLGAIAFDPKGEFDVSATYAKFDIVDYLGNLYVATEDVPTGTLPTDVTYWKLFLDIADVLNTKADKSVVDAIETRVETCENEITKMQTLITGTLTAGETTIELIDDSITADSIIDPYVDVPLGVESENISYATKKIEVGKVTFTFNPLDTNITVGIIVK